jgi:hypothetical protein
MIENSPIKDIEKETNYINASYIDVIIQLIFILYLIKTFFNYFLNYFKNKLGSFRRR